MTTQINTKIHAIVEQIGVKMIIIMHFVMKSQDMT